MAITALPTPPSRSDPTNFSDRADAFLLALPVFVTQANSLLTDVNNKTTSVTTLEASATDAADAALVSQTAAAASASSASTSASTATTQATNASTTYTNFDKKFLGSKTANPTVDNQGAALAVGAFYWNSSANQLRFYTGSAWVTANVVVSDFVDLTNNQTVAGTKTFSSTISGSIDGNAATVTNGVYNTGTQTIAGLKTFSNNVTIKSGTTEMRLLVGSSLGYLYGNASTTGWTKSGGGTLAFTFSNGDLVTSGNVAGYSDERLKFNWQNLRANFTEQLATVKMGTYTRKDTKEVQVGVSAQSLEAILPEAVLKDKNGMLSVSYGNAALAACVELAREIVLLKAEIKALKEAK